MTELRRVKTKDDEMFETWWIEFRLDHPEWRYADTHALIKAAHRAGRLAQREKDAGICDKQALLPECPERASYCAAAIREMEI